jgi:hypothetical protein
MVPTASIAAAMYSAAADDTRNNMAQMAIITVQS